MEHWQVSRRRFVQQLGVGASIIGAAALGLDRSARASISSGNPDGVHVRNSAGRAASVGDPEIVVVGMADHRQDAANVQWAVDNVSPGGTVKLRGLFNFSDYDPQLGSLNYRPYEVYQAYAPWYGDHFLGLPMYYLPESAQRYVEFAVPGPGGIPYYVDPYLGIPLFPASTPMPKLPVVEFGADERRVFVNQDVHIAGDDAVIRGGFWPFTVGSVQRPIYHDFFFDTILTFPWDSVRWDPVSASVDPERSVDVTIESISFVDAWMITLACEASTRLTVRNNTFGDMRGFDIANWVLEPGQSFSGIHHPGAYPILVNSIGASTMPELARDLVAGTVFVGDNRFEGHAREIDVSPSTGSCPVGYREQPVVIDHASLTTAPYCVPVGATAQLRALELDGRPAVYGRTGATVAARLMLLSADVVLARNVVSGVSSIGLTCESTYGTSLITDNSVDLPGVPEGEGWFSSAIWVSGSSGGDSPGTSQSVVTRNRLIDRNPDTLDTIVLNDLVGAIVSHNRIDMVGQARTRTAIGVSGCKDSSIVANKVTGSGDLAVFAGPSQAGAPAARNDFVGNSLSIAETQLTYLFLPETHSNIVRGYSGGNDSVLDLNPTGPYAELPNRISGVTSMAHAQQTDSAVARRSKSMLSAERRDDALAAVRKQFGRATQAEVSAAR